MAPVTPAVSTGRAVRKRRLLEHQQSQILMLMFRRICLMTLIFAIILFAGVGAAGHVWGIWAVVPVGEEQVLYMDSFDGVCSIGWHSNNSQQGMLVQTTGRWMAGTDLTGMITPYYGRPSSEHEPQIRAKYIDVTYVGYLPWLDGGEVGVPSHAPTSGGRGTSWFRLGCSWPYWSA